MFNELHYCQIVKKIINTEAEIWFISTKFNKIKVKIKRFYLFFTHFFSFAGGGKYSPRRIHQKVFNDLCYIHKVTNF